MNLQIVIEIVVVVIFLAIFAFILIPRKGFSAHNNGERPGLQPTAFQEYCLKHGGSDLDYHSPEEIDHWYATHPNEVAEFERKQERKICR